METKFLYLSLGGILGLLLFSILAEDSALPSHKTDSQNAKQDRANLHVRERKEPTLDQRGIPIPEADGTYTLKGRDEFGKEKITKGLTLTQYQCLKHLKSEVRRPYFQWIETISTDTLTKISTSLKPLNSAAYTEKPVSEWREGYDAVVAVTNVPVPIGDPRLIYQNSDYFLFAHENHPDFNQGHAVEKDTGIVSRWNVQVLAHDDH